MYKKLFLIIITAFVFLGYANFAVAQGFTYSDSIDHYSFDLPDGWREIPKSVIDQFVDEVVEQTGDQRIEYDAGFQLIDGEYFQYPYILMQEYTVNSPSYDEIEKILNRDTDKEMEEYSELVRNASFDEPFIDKERNIVFMNAEIGVTDFGIVKGLFAIFLGSQHTTRLYFYVLESEYSHWFPIFSSIIDSFSYDAGYEYDEIEAEKNNSKGIFDGVAEETLIGGIVGLILGMLILFFRSKKKNKIDNQNVVEK